jgi:pyruvate dehydrogenase E1 component beta subunit
VGLLSPLTEDEQTTFIVVSLADTVLRKLVGRLGTAPKGTRLDSLSMWELADTLVDYYANDAEVSSEVDRTLRRELEASPLGPAVDADGGGGAVTTLFLESKDPARDLAWALLGAAREEDRALAPRLVQTIMAEFDHADEQAKADAQAKPKTESQVVRETERLARKAEKEAHRADSQRERALQRVGYSGEDAKIIVDQIVDNAATFLHMSGGQVAVPLVIRMTTGAGRQLAAQHSHSFEGWYAHVPGLRVLAPATHTDARHMLQPALDDPDPVVIFEHGAMYGVDGVVDAGPVDIDHAARRRTGTDVTIVTYGGSLPKVLEAASVLAGRGVEAEVVDLRVLRPLDTATFVESAIRTHRAVVVDESWRAGGLGAEVAAQIAEHAFYDLDAPVARVATAEVPLPYAKHLEDAALPSVDRIVDAVLRCGG